MATYTLDWSETNLGGSAVVSYARGTLLDFTDKPVGATAALSCTAAMGAGDHMLAVFTVETSGSSVMTFEYHVSTEAGWDKLHIDVDGVSQANYSGLVAWTTHPGISIPTAGVHTIRFRYFKDAGDMNADRVWVANLNITNTVTVNDSSGTVDTYDMEDGAIPAVVSTSSWTNSTSAPIAGSRSLRSPASPAHSASYDLTVTKPAGSDYGTIGFDYKTSTEAGWDKLQVFPDPLASGKAEFSGTTSGHLAVILPPAESSILVRYIKDGGGASGSDAVWIDNLTLPAGAPSDPPGEGSGTGTVTFTGSASGSTVRRGTGSGSLAFAGAATGSAPAVDPATGSGNGTLAFVGAASGKRYPRGSSAGAVAWSGTATGSAPAVDGASGSAVGSVAWSGAAAGARTPKGTGSGSLALVGTATGTTTRIGTATGLLTFSGTATGRSAAATQVVVGAPVAHRYTTATPRPRHLSGTPLPPRYTRRTT